MRRAMRMADGTLGAGWAGCGGVQRTREAYDRNKLNYSSDAHILDISWEWHARAFMSGSKTFDEDFFLTLARLDAERKERQNMVPNRFGIMGELMDKSLEYAGAGIDMSKAGMNLTMDLGKAGMDLTSSALDATGVNTLANTALRATSEGMNTAKGATVGATMGATSLATGATGNMWTKVRARSTVSLKISARRSGLGYRVLAPYTYIGCCEQPEDATHP